MQRSVTEQQPCGTDECELATHAIVQLFKASDKIRLSSDLSAWLSSAAGVLLEFQYKLRAHSILHEYLESAEDI